MATIERVRVRWSSYSHELTLDMAHKGRLSKKAADFEDTGRHAGIAVLALYGISKREYVRTAKGLAPVVAYQDDRQRRHVGEPERLGIIPRGNRPAIALPMPPGGIQRGCIGFMHPDSIPTLLDTAGIDTEDMPRYSEWDAEGLRHGVPLLPMQEGHILSPHSGLSKVVIARNLP